MHQSDQYISPRSPDWRKCIAVYQPEVSPQSTDGADQCLVKLKAPPSSWKPYRVSQRSLDRDCSSKWSHLTGTGPETSCWSRSYAKPRRRRRVSATLAKTRARRTVWYLHWTIDWGHCTALLRHKLLGHIRPIQQWLSNLIAQLLFPTRSCKGRQSHNALLYQAGCAAFLDDPKPSKPSKPIMHKAPHKICSYMSRPGPKSRSGILLSIMIMQSISSSQAVATDARVAGIVTRPAGAYQAIRATSSHQEAKHRGSQVTPSSEVPGSFREYEHLTRTGKRSYHRAVLRAAKHGTTTYRGRQHTLRTLGTGQHTIAKDSARSPISLTCRGPVPVSEQRCRVVTWNSGGLTTAKLAEIELWLDDCQQQGSTSAS